MEALKFFGKVDDDTLVIPMPMSYRGQEVEVIVLKKAEAESEQPALTKDEKLAVIRQYAGIFANSEWQPGPDPTMRLFWLIVFPLVSSFLASYDATDFAIPCQQEGVTLIDSDEVLNRYFPVS